MAKNSIVVAICLALGLQGAVTAQAQPAGGGSPPPEAFSACQGKQTQDDCSISLPHGLEKGKCMPFGQRSVCVPNKHLRPYAYEVYPDASPRVVLHNRIPDTGQPNCFNGLKRGTCATTPYKGQDGQYASPPMAYDLPGDGTVVDKVTGLTWQKQHNRQRITFPEARAACDDLTLGGYDDWRLPTIKELFSIADFQGSTGGRFFIDPAFDLEIPSKDVLKGDRYSTHFPAMMGQTWSSTIYTGPHMDRWDIKAAFFYNFLDGHLKQAPLYGLGLFYRCVRGPEWGVNQFRITPEDTVVDDFSGLEWQRSDDGVPKDWYQALYACETLDHAGKTDWRLPNAKELQSIVDYRQYDPALDTKFLKMSTPKGWFWSSTTHGDSIGMGVYICFGKCSSVDGIDFHGAGAQRSDPKYGDPKQWGPLGGQRDQVRIYNYVRCVRDAG